MKKLTLILLATLMGFSALSYGLTDPVVITAPKGTVIAVSKDTVTVASKDAVTEKSDKKVVVTETKNPPEPTPSLIKELDSRRQDPSLTESWADEQLSSFDPTSDELIEEEELSELEEQVVE